MKNFVKICLAIFSILFLTACEKTENNPAPVVLNADNILDQQIYKNAVNAEESKICESIKDPNTNLECVKVADALATTTNAVDNYDLKMCKQIELERYQKNCLSEVEKEIEKKEKIAEQYEKDRNDEENRIEIESEAIENNNPEICKKIENLNQSESCIYNVIISEAITQKDEKLCNMLSSEEFISSCKEMIQVN